jgi:hypothetical protein
MTDQSGKLRDETALAGRARQLMGDELMVGVFTNLLGIYTAQWAGCTDAAVRDRIWLKVQALNDVRAELETMIVTGKLASHALANPPPPRLDS